MVQKIIGENSNTGHKIFVKKTIKLIERNKEFNRDKRCTIFLDWRAKY